MNGKDKCKLLRDVREKIATENGIPYRTEECKHTGECQGTCPKCESELRYLERKLEERKRLGQKIAVAGVALTLGITMSGCRFFESEPRLVGDIMMPGTQTHQLATGETVGVLEIDPGLDGDMLYIPPFEDISVRGKDYIWDTVCYLPKSLLEEHWKDHLTLSEENKCVFEHLSDDGTTYVVEIVFSSVSGEAEELIWYSHSPSEQ